MNNWRKSSHSFANGNCAEVASWRKSSASYAEANCVEVGQAETIVGVRDTTDRSGPVLMFSAAAWTAFLTRVRA